MSKTIRVKYAFLCVLAIRIKVGGDSQQNLWAGEHRLYSYKKEDIITL